MQVEKKRVRLLYNKNSGNLVPERVNKSYKLGRNIKDMRIFIEYLSSGLTYITYIAELDIKHTSSSSFFQIFKVLFKIT